MNALAASPTLSSLPAWAFPAFLVAATGGVLWALWRADVIRPGSFKPTPAGQRDVWGVPAPVWFVSAAMVFLSQQVSVGLAHQAFPGVVPLRAATARDHAVIALVAYPSALVVGGVVLYLLGPRAGERSGLRVRPSDAGPGLVGALAMTPICLLTAMAAQRAATLVRGTPPDPVGHETLKMIAERPSDAWSWVLIAGAVLGAPVVEEILFRGLLQSCFLSLLGRTWPAIAATSAVFAAVHAAVVPPEALALLLVLGVAFGVAFERTRRLGVPIVMHVLFNAANVAVTLLMGR